jgi:hypothetical protein
MEVKQIHIEKPSYWNALSGAAKQASPMPSETVLSFGGL